MEASSTVEKASGGATIVDELATKVESAERQRAREAEERAREQEAAREKKQKDREDDLRRSRVSRCQ